MRVSTKLIWTVAILAAGMLAASSASAQDNASQANATTESFAGTFFVSKATHADGTQSIDVFGSLLVWLLLTLSMVNVGLIGYLALTNQRKHIVPAGVVNEVRRMVNAGQYRAALDLTAQEQSFFSRVLHAGLSEASHGYSAVVRSLEQSADALIAARMRPIELLYMFGQVSPMMGLLGTVYGIIFAFRVFVAMGGRASPALLAGGIGTALVATFWGLVVAIPALAAYSILRNKVDHLTMEAITAAEELLAQFRPKAAAASTAGPVAKPSPTPKPALRD